MVGDCVGGGQGGLYGRDVARLDPSYERDAGKREGVTTAEKERIRLLERQLRLADEILRKASASFAQAELDRPFTR
ncbi:hypothetical protein BRM22_16145 [Xanthomonas oryzae pv. oryzae]|nr:hypothetical protein B9W05_16610 [Xanthomonas oryzae pv. oryzae]QUW76684.1 hypothetical protein KCI36_06845 [Xanthomonas oryzae]AXI19173.1 hypothetical protein CDO19_22375 [Xanthomonas oryzae pv. oryzae]AXI23163.1 hypothetical protein CDO11_22405 [Xanthomonas oryzae pv. oryzae]AXM11300.1 hypothetical protein BRM60_22365 [Xanthomonas oryzae pv. oryzae]